MEKKKNDSLPFVGEVNPVIFWADGRVEDRGWQKNLVPEAGQNWLATYLSTAPGSAMNHMNVGTGTTAPVFGDTTLAGAVGSRVTLASRLAATNILTSVGTFAGFVSGVTSLVLREVGIFNHAVTGGTMMARATFASITLGDSDNLQINHRLSCGSRA